MVTVLDFCCNALSEHLSDHPRMLASVPKIKNGAPCTPIDDRAIALEQPIPITMPHLALGIEYSRSYEWRPLAILITNVPVMPLSSPVPEPGTTTIVIFDPLASIVASC